MSSSLMLASRAGNRHGSKAHNGTINTSRPDEIWGTELTTTVTTKEGFEAALFFCVGKQFFECFVDQAFGCFVSQGKISLGIHLAGFYVSLMLRGGHQIG